MYDVIRDVIREAISVDMSEEDEGRVAEIATDDFIRPYVMTPEETVDDICDMSGMDMSEMVKKYFDYNRFIDDCCDESTYIIVKIGFGDDEDDCKKRWKIAYSMPPGYIIDADDIKIVRIDNLIEDVKEEIRNRPIQVTVEADPINVDVGVDPI